MSEDWNLQDQMKHILCEGLGNVGVFTKVEYTKAGGADVTNPRLLDLLYFCPSTLEVLRKELIEDFSRTGHYGSEVSKAIINKRFGVKE